ncbi:MAG TPA: hypothetical protein VJJ70_06655 [Anaerolineales bacterium]|nr:hypothetical protein [Anaerolineales bacterium]
MLNLILWASGLSPIDWIAKRRAWRSRGKALAEIGLLAFSFVFPVLPSVVLARYAPWVSQLLAISDFHFTIGGQ